jgi:hypothetical protein
MSALKKAVLFFTLATLLSTVGMIFLEPWIISENIEGVGVSSRQWFGYTLVAAAILSNVVATVFLVHLRGWQLTGVNLWKKVIAVTAGLVQATLLLLISYTVSIVAAQWIVQPF